MADKFLDYAIDYLGIFGLISLGIFLFFKYLESNASEKARTDVSGWLNGKVQGNYFAFLVHEAFVKIFGERIRPSLFVKTAIISVSTVSIIFIYVAYTGGYLSADFLESEDRWMGVNLNVLVLLGYIFINICVDTISVIETGWILKLLTKKSSKSIIFYIILDLVLTNIIFIMTFYLAAICWAYADPYSEFAGTNILYNAWTILQIAFPAAYYPDDITFPFLISTHVTSMWIWIFGIGIILSKLFKLNKYFFGSNQKPFIVVGISGSMFVVSLWVILMALKPVVELFITK